MTKNSEIEQWTLYSIGVTVILLRIFTRTKLVGFKGWKGDDYMVILALACSTTQLVMHELLINTGTIGGITQEAAAKLTPEQVATKQYGSKLNFVSWIAYTSLMWSLKGCMLFLYARLTIGLKESKLVIWSGVVVALTYVGMILLIVFNCFPTWKNWTLFPNPGQCTYNLPHFYLGGTVNILTDILLLFIPIPLIRRSRLPMNRKIGVGVILCGGIFIIIASILNNLFSLLYKYDALYGILNHHFVDTVTGNAIFILNWGVREAFIGILVVNIPCIKPLFSSAVWLKTRTSRSKVTGASGFGTGAGIGGGAGAPSRVSDQDISDNTKTDEEDHHTSKETHANAQQDFYNFSRKKTQKSIHNGRRSSTPTHFRYDSDDGTLTLRDDSDFEVADDFRSDIVRMEEGVGSRGTVSFDRYTRPSTANSAFRKQREFSPVVRV